MVVLIIAVNVLISLCLAMRHINYIQLEGYCLGFNKHELSHWTWVIMSATVGALLSLGLSYVDNEIVEAAIPYLFYLPLIIYIAIDWFRPKKTATSFTARVVRWLFTLALIMIGITIGLEYLSRVFFIYSGAFYFIGYVLLPLTVRLALVINLPLENGIRAYYFNRAKKVLDSRSDIIRIGVTGSYGKTTVKNILAQMLSKKYNVLASPLSYNTPMGFARTLNDLTADTEVLIMEIGARRQGDVRKIAEALHPNIAVITGIAPCHMETFRSIDRVVQTKYELIETLSDEGIAIFNGANAYVRNMYEHCPLYNKELVSQDVGHVIVCDLKTSAKGSEFMLHIGEESVACKTKLIGEHNIQNILLAVTVALRMGVSVDDICESIYDLESPPHRLQVLEANGVTIIDDSYNANPIGAEASIRALSLFRQRKVVLCQGMVELGELEYKENYELGGKLSAVADLVILVGSMASIIREGLLDSGYNPTKIVMCASLSDAIKRFGELLRAGDVLLLMNDLPDNY